MSRREFSKKVRGEAFLRCKGLCENCGARLKVGEGEYDHRVPDALGGEPTLANCQVLCVPCHRGKGGKTAQDQADIAKANRRWLKHTGAWPKSKAPLRSRGFAKTRNGS